MAVRKTSEGFLIIPSIFARSGIYDYMAAELRNWGVPIPDTIPPEAIVKLYRDPADVFDAESMASFEHKPVTNQHPTGAVTPQTLKNDLVGLSLAPVEPAPDAKHLRVDVQLMADEAIKEYERGVRQLSAGYSAKIVMSPGITEDGQPYDMRQTDIVGNHIALVQRGRAGTARLLDKEMEMNEPKIDAVEHGKVKQQLADAESTIADLKKENESLKGQVAGLKESQLSDEELAAKVADGVAAELDRLKERDEIIDAAMEIAPQLKVTDAMSIKDIMSEAIKAKSPSHNLKDATDDYVRGVFSTFADGKKKDIKDKKPDTKPTNPATVSFKEAKRLAWG